MNCQPSPDEQPVGTIQAAAPLLGELDVYLITQGQHWQLADCLGAHLMTLNGQAGARFAVWAPNASQVSVVGRFNDWASDTHRMHLHAECGVWALFIPGVVAGDLYKYDVRASNGATLPLKADPLARQTELAPGTASVVSDSTPFVWTDHAWMAHRAQRQQPGAAMSVYEVHLGSWRHTDQPGSLWVSLGSELIAYAVDMGFTHIELLPITEHPFGGSWGYQPLGMFAPTARYGTPAEFSGFVDACHQAGLGLILDWVPAHFPNDPHGLARFDGTALYEHADPQQGWHPDWDTMIYNLGRTEVRNFLLASALEWLERYHVDGLRVDAVASMLYLDYSREAGQWTPNCYGGRENLEAISFFQQLHQLVAERCPGAITIAEESTAWPGVTAPTSQGGLGFNYKWNMGWMHDSLRYMQHDPIHRRYHHNDLTFSMIYAYSERFVLPLSHDEVVHGKQALLEKMPGDHWQKFANLRAYYGFMWCHPGTKLLFMGGEIALSREWDHDAPLNWAVLVDPWHVGIQNLVKDLNHLYRRTPALHASDFDPSGFQWVIEDDPMHSVFAYLRRHGTQLALVVVNMTPVPRSGWDVGVPVAGLWHEVLNTDATRYGGTNLGNMGMTSTTDKGAHGQAQSLTLTLPPLATLILMPEGDVS